MTSRPCIDCGTVTGGSRCDSCRLALAAEQERHRDRPSPSRRGYGSRWAGLSRRARRQQPWCSRCGATDDLTADHVTPLAAGGPRLPRVDGVDVLCRACNSAKHDRLPTTGGGDPGGTPVERSLLYPLPKHQRPLHTPGDDAA